MDYDIAPYLFVYLFICKYVYIYMGIHGGKPLERLITQQRPSWSKPGREILRGTNSSDTDDLGAGWTKRC